MCCPRGAGSRSRASLLPLPSSVSLALCPVASLLIVLPPVTPAVLTVLSHFAPAVAGALPVVSPPPTARKLIVTSAWKGRQPQCRASPVSFALALPLRADRARGPRTGQPSAHVSRVSHVTHRHPRWWPSTLALAAAPLVAGAKRGQGFLVPLACCHSRSPRSLSRGFHVVVSPGVAAFKAASCHGHGGEEQRRPRHTLQTATGNRLLCQQGRPIPGPARPALAAKGQGFRPPIRSPRHRPGPGSPRPARPSQPVAHTARPSSGPSAPGPTGLAAGATPQPRKPTGQPAKRARPPP